MGREDSAHVGSAILLRTDVPNLADEQCESVTALCSIQKD